MKMEFVQNAAIKNTNLNHRGCPISLHYGGFDKLNHRNANLLDRHLH